MGRIVLGIIAVAASLMLVESLTCNSCTFSLVGFCLNQGEVNCMTNTSVCYTGRVAFTTLTSFVGFNNQGCRLPAGCNVTTNGTLLGAPYQTRIECCSTDRCNAVQISGAPSTKITLTAAIGTTILASVLGSLL
ncbi:hypothetical protein LDENG_00190660 [Lucifuga dentata]|nr:hypothetical protein LDENG_00190660 [Lucifuga dentata]